MATAADSSPSEQTSGVPPEAADFVPAAVPTESALTASDLGGGTPDRADGDGTPESSAGVSSAITIYPVAKDTQRMVRVGCFKDDEHDRCGLLLLVTEKRGAGGREEALCFVSRVGLPFCADPNWCNGGLCNELGVTHGGLHVCCFLQPPPAGR